LLLGRTVERGGLSVSDPRMSRNHARIAWDGRTNCFRVGDMESANGTHVDGVRVRTGALRHRSVLRLGGTVFALIEQDSWAALESRLEPAARSPLSILITGETGTGKEVIARRLHELSGRSGAFVAVNCAALPRELLPAELFGHARGAFSGAATERPGLFRAAHQGTLFLDEIGDMPLELQPTLLRVLQERVIRPVGSEREVAVDVRVLSATHQALPARIRDGAFRLDLHSRLAQLELHVPALRERPHGIPGLLAELARGMQISPRLTADAVEAFALAEWPENVRELQSVLGRLKLFRAPEYLLDRSFLEAEAPQLLRPRSTSVVPPSLPAPSGTAEPMITRERLEQVLAEHHGKVQQAAQALGTSRTQVYRWLERYGIETPTRRPR
jgi:transcriptional regulator with GAF, ATPase, and Fis domain